LAFSPLRYLPVNQDSYFTYHCTVHSLHYPSNCPQLGFNSPTVESALYQNFETNIHRNEAAWPCSHFLHWCIWEQFKYSQDQSSLDSHSLSKL